MVDTDSPSQALGAVLGGRYRLVRVLGEGGLATVYEAEGLQGQGRRAIKLLQPQFQAQRNVVERFYAEARACHALHHPHIARVEEFAYAEDGSPYIVMELLVGQSLDDYLRTHPPMAPAAAGPLLLEALAALSVAHAAGIVHRDIKPPNLFIVQAPSGGSMLKVLDFGIAKVMDVAGGMGRKTRTGAVLGTPGYMSAEQLKDAKSCDARSDLWSLGVVFYEMLTHRHPYGDDDQMARAVAILRDPPRPLYETAPHLSAWEPFFQQALARDPNERFQSAEAMGTRIRELLQHADASTSWNRGDGAQGYRAAPGSGGNTLTSEQALGLAGVNSFGPSVHAGGGPFGYAPPIEVVTAEGLEAPSVVWWAVLLLAIGSFASGLLLGYLLAS